MECELCNNDKEKDFIYALNGNIICSLCGCVYQKKLYDDFIENYDLNYCYKKRIFYKKINYLSEILNKINSYINITIDNNLIKKIKNEIKNNYNNEINYYNIRKIIKKMKLGKYYKYIPYFINVLNKNQFYINLSEKKNIINRFIQIDKIYNNVKNEIVISRKKFLSYSYVLRKICDIL
jgi:hypothetical protein